MRLALLVSVLGFLLAVAPASARTVLLGRSWQGRPIRASEVGNPSGTRVLVVGCIHGNETAGIAIADALAKLAPLDLDLWIGIYAPAGMPPAVLARLNSEIDKVLQHPELKAAFAKIGIEPRGTSPEKAAAFTRAEFEKWKKVIVDGKIKPE